MDGDRDYYIEIDIDLKVDEHLDGESIFKRRCDFNGGTL